MKMLLSASILVLFAGTARAQPGAPPPPEEPPPLPVEPAPPAPEPAPPAPEPLVSEQPLPPPPPAAPETPTVQPEMFTVPTGRLLPAGHIMTRSGVDTGGGLSSGLRLGLGDVAEFGVELTDLVRRRDGVDGEVGRLYPYGAASFKMGVGEDSLFRWQPAVALGFRKSFERDTDGHATRFAELYLVASRSLGPRTQLHLGGSLWDAQIDSGGTVVHLHDGDAIKQLRAFGGLEIEPLPESAILLELGWMPEFVYGPPDRIKLAPMFTWGVRYSVTGWMAIESGVRIPDIRDVDLLGAQIFGQLKFVSRALERMMKRGR
ncbi:MAG TPA: hypothetical protein VL172_19915 [Kofleriaceae bacterium]|nr:hypothetical protein [Kofleriaceae bacterium]